MRCRAVFRVSQSRNRAPLLLQPQASRLYSQLQSKHERSTFGIAFDIDGVVLRGRVPIGGSPQALRRLYGESGALKVPFIFLTNGGGIPESRRAIELSDLLGVYILPSQVVQGHSSFKTLLKRYENELTIATGKGEPDLVMSEYGFKKVLSLDEYASYFENIDPVSQYKMWTTKWESSKCSCPKNLVPSFNITSDRVKAAFVVSDPVDWGRDIQVLCDILSSGGLPGDENGQQPPLYFAADDLEYQCSRKIIDAGQLKWFEVIEPTLNRHDLCSLGVMPISQHSKWTSLVLNHQIVRSWHKYSHKTPAAFPSERLGMGAFRIALESVFNRIHCNALDCVIFGKPNLFVFKNAEAILRQLRSSCDDNYINNGNNGSHPFKTLYMIGDNPLVDIKGAKQAGHPWFSILTRTGVFRGKDNHAEFPADLVVDTVEEAVDYILKKESAC
ncbi:hypothetical protein I3843_01G269800 [Carya illinoinensis]|nr:hypothetical protein I3843_01G269800 [Carya illinoinensis]